MDGPISEKPPIAEGLMGNGNKLVDWTPKLGQEFNSEEEAWNFYVLYAGRMGFGARKEHVNKDPKTKVVTSRLYVCAKEGFRGKDKRDRITKNPREETRCGCLARMGIKRRKNGKYHVYKLEVNHNHILPMQCIPYTLLSQDGITGTHGQEIKLVEALGLSSGQIYGLPSRQVGGRTSLGFIGEDSKTYLQTRRQKSLKFGEAGVLLRYFQQQSLENPSFYYAMQLDIEEQITNIFWSDAKMMVDYAQFGDVITFDTTYTTNKESRPLGVFVGFNHHMELTIFGAALMYDKTIVSFEWLFSTFLEVHQYKKPFTIFTDQCAEMTSALFNVMPEVHHCLCIWHIMQHGIKYLGNLFEEGGELLNHFKKCIFDYEDETEFEEAWKEMLDKHDILDRSWLDSIYKVKDKWARAYMKRYITRGMRSMQLNESFNINLKGYLKYDLDIARFFKHFERVVDEMRHKQLEIEFHSRQKLPSLVLKKCPMLRQAVMAYTPAIYEMFVDQFDESLGASIKERAENGDIHEYDICIPDEKYVHKVTTKLSDQTFCCSCRKFETFGILCGHILKVLTILDMHYIPNQYILKRWTREASNETGLFFGAREDQDNTKLTVGNRYRIMCSSFIKIASRAAENEETFAMACKMANELRDGVDGILQNNIDNNITEDGVFVPVGLKRKRLVDLT